MFNIDLAIVFIYLAITLFVGIYTGRNIRNIKEYAIGGQNFSSSTLTATLTATWIGALSLVGLNESVYKSGIVWVFITMGGVVEILILREIAPGLIKFKGCISAAEVLGKWFGKRARILTGISTAMYSMGIIGTQVAAIGLLFNEFYGISPAVGIIIAAGVVVLYSSFGGIKAVTYTDVIQFAFFIVAMPLIANTLLGEVGGFKGLITNIPAEHLKVFPSYGSKLHFITLFLFFVIPFCDACLMQRVLMAKDHRQIMVSFKSTAIVMFCFYVLCGIIALCAYCIDPNLNSSAILYHMVKNYLPVGIKGVGIAGMMAVLMSTADSYLHMSSVVMVNDVINPLRKNPLSSKAELRIMKLTTFIIGISSIFIAISSDSIMQLMIKSWIVWAPIAVVPLYFALLGIKSNAQTFGWSALLASSLVVIWEILGLEGKTGVSCNIPAVVVALMVFGVMSYYYYKYAPEKLMDAKLDRIVGDRRMALVG